MTNAILRGKPDAGNPHVRFDEGVVASAKPRRGSLLYRKAHEEKSHLRLVKEDALRGGVTLLLTACACLLSDFAAGAEIAVGTRVRANVTCAGDATQGGILLAPQSELGLSVSGERTVAADELRAAADARLSVLSGTVSLKAADGTKAAFAEPAVLAKAAFWVKADANVVTGENGADVTEWRDARETEGLAAADCRYPRAVADHTLTEASPVRRTIADGKPSVYFGGRQSLVACQWTKRADGAIYPMTGIRHVFYAHAVFDAYGYVLGGAKGTAHSFNLQHADGYPDQPVAGMNATDATELFTARVYVDGELVDPQHTPVAKGRISVHEYEFLDPARASAFYNERFLNNGRAGGDDLCEAIVFTNRLTEAERLAVGAYLNDRWRGHVSVTPRLSVARGATLATELVGETALDLSGDGCVALTGAGTLALTNAASFGFAGEIRPASGTAVYQGAVAPLVLASSGQVLDVSDVCATVAAGAAGTIRKTGEGPAILRAVPDGTKELVVAEGTLTLSESDATAVGAAEDAEIADPSFENIATAWQRKEDDFTWSPTTGGAIAVYNVKRYDGSASYCGPYDTLAPNDHVGNSQPAPDGRFAMFLSDCSSLALSVNFRRAGVYELSFRATARKYDRQGNRYDVRLVQDGVTNDIARVTTWDGEYRTYRYVTPRLSAGAGELLVEAVPECLAAGALFDDFRLVWRSPEAEDVVRVPNGDFEGEVAWPLPDGYAPRAVPVFGPGNAVAGWSFAQGDGWDASSMPRVGVTSPAMGEDALHPSRYNNRGENRSGENQLAFLSAGGCAETAAFDVPEGSYRVRADIGWFTVTPLGGNAANNCNRLQSVTVEAKVCAADWQTLGTYSTAEKRLTPTVAEGLFTVAAGEKVALRFTATNNRGCLLMDNVALVPTASDNLLVSAYPGDTTHWSYEAQKNEGGANSDAARVWYTTDWSGNYWGVTLCPARGVDTMPYVRLTQRGVAKTAVVFPAAGRYRLTFWAAQRRSGETANPTRGNCPVGAWLADATGVKRTIAYTRVDHDSFARYAFTFDVAAPGAYTLGLQAMNDYPDGAADHRTVRLDCVAVTKAGAAAKPTLPYDLTIRVEKGALLRLDYTGTNQVGKVRLGGRSARGVISAETHPSFVSGPGALFVERRGCCVIVR